jgi:hypothetical protein
MFVRLEILIYEIQKINNIFNYDNGLIFQKYLRRKFSHNIEKLIPKSLLNLDIIWFQLRHNR